MMAGLPLDTNRMVREAEKEKLLEARAVPTRRRERIETNPKTLEKRHGAAAAALKHLQQAITALEKVPSTDMDGRVPSYIGELEDIKDGDDGLEAFVQECQKSIRSRKISDSKVAKEEEEKSAMRSANYTINQAEEEEYEEEEYEEDCEMSVTESDEESKDGLGKRATSNIKKAKEKASDEKTERKSQDSGYKKMRGWHKGDRVKWQGKNYVIDVLDFVGLRDEDTGTIANARAVDLTRIGGAADPDAKAEDVEQEAKAKAEKVKEGRQVYGNVDVTNTKVPNGDPHNVATGNARGLYDPINDDKDESPESPKMYDQTKIKIPARIKKLLATEIKELRKAADKVVKRDKALSYFYSNTADAFDVIMQHFDTGTEYAMKMAQVDTTKLMSPMIQRLPDEVYDYIIRCGKTKKLGDFFREVKYDANK